jgi:Lipocalin-like domain
MKKLLGLALMAGLFASCSDDDSASTSVNMDLLFRKWYPTTWVVNGQSMPYDDHEECGNDYLEFMSGGTAKFVDVWDCEEYVDEGTYTVDGNVITTNLDEFGNESVEVKKLTSTDLVIEQTYTEEGVTVTVQQKFKSSL